MPEKIFIIGLPRTGTTSVCHSFLKQGFKTAHTAYTKECFKQAQVLADTPIFADFARLDLHYPNSKFINLTRNLELWIPSIRQLLTRMHTNLMRQDGGFNIHLKRCYLETFKDLNLDNINNDDYLLNCYEAHQSKVNHYFKNRFQNRENDLLNIDIAEPEAGKQLQAFMQTEHEFKFVKMNIAGKVTAWNDLKHPLKVASTRNGKIDKDLGYPNKIL